MAKLTVRDNQWWFTTNPLPGSFEGCRYLVLSIEGRECPMVRSSDGRDGRPTYSFKFLNAQDRELWVSLSGQEVEAEVVQRSDEPPDLDLGFGDDEPLEVPSPPPKAVTRGLVTEISRSGVTHFDAYVFADWSANSAPKRGKDSIWIADAHFGTNRVLVTEVFNPPTRAEATAELFARLNAHVGAGRLVLVGFDFPFGYPKQAYSQLFPRTPAWATLWEHLGASVHDDARNANNRFEVASDLNASVGQNLFWGCPTARSTAHLRPTKGQRHAVTEYRVVEQQLRTSGKKAFAVWQLFGNGSVGSQALVGIPRIRELRQTALLRGVVWPFETGLVLPDRSDASSAVWAEIWPGCISFDGTLHATRDAAQMLGYARWAAQCDVRGDLRSFFEIQGISGPEKQAITNDEGWILGFQP
jgi:precorrin-8X/cobalt-precorrin-8 methylmutase